MRILITGAHGMLGTDLISALQLEHDLIGVDIDDFDIADANQTLLAIKSIKPQIVVHAAAYTAVDQCENEEEKAFRVNRNGSGNVAEACQKIGSKMIYYSSDYIFDGDTDQPYTENSAPNPLSVYGQSKLEGEIQVQKYLPKDHLIIRTSWLFGINGKNFVDTIITLTNQKSKLQIIDDQTGSPTFTADLAEATRHAIGKNFKGIINITNSGETTWYGFATHFLKFTRPDFPIEPVKSIQYPLPAQRPKYSVLSNQKWLDLTGALLPNWRDAVDRYISLRQS